MTTASVTRPWTRRLGDSGAGLPELGGKGASLARMAAAGLPVPNGFHITTSAYDDFVAVHDLQSRIEELAADHDAAAIQRLFVDHEMPDPMRTTVLDAYAALSDEGPAAMRRAKAVAVRSSATAEDLPGLSFAGQQDTFLNIRGNELLIAAVQRCWASLWTERAIHYREREQIAAGEVSLAVVVQDLVDAEAAGIMFTADPMTGSRELVQINAAPGLGEAVVGGQVTPDSYLVDAASGRLQSSKINEKLIMTVRTETGTEEQTVPDHQRSEPTLTQPQAEDLAALGLKVSAFYGESMDIEWALESDAKSGPSFALLQARPITTGIDPDPWNDARDVNQAWTNTNVGEAIPDVMTPATWWLVQGFLEEAMSVAATDLYRAFGRISGRIYLNLSLLMSLTGAVGMSEARFRTMVEEVFGRIPDEVPIPKARVPRLRVIITVVPVAVRVLIHAKRDMLTFPDYVAEHPERCDRLRDQIGRIGDPVALADFWRATLNPAFRESGRMLSAATRSSGTSFISIRAKLRKVVGEEDANALTAGQGGQAGQLASLGLLVGLEQVANGEIDRREFNRTYGHRGPHEFEVSLPRPAEDPEWIDQQLAQRTPDDVTASSLLTKQQQNRDDAWERLQHDHPNAARRFGQRLDTWARISREREEARSEVVRLFWVMRDYLLKAGELTGLGGDVFFLDLEELAEVLLGTAADHQLIKERRGTYKRYLALPPAPSLVSGCFDPFRWAVDPRRRSDLYVEGSAAETGETIAGFAGSAGVVEGTARVVFDVAEGTALQPGEILVTGITNVGWTPLFPRAAAVVTDVGAPLSHAAIVARELGIPAVVGCGNATMRITTGDRVRVDGSAGTVEVLTAEG